ncbi:MAG: hypothetical protein OQL16_11175, partial [Gammaproteobacteria bacterium]|nr:hypothetical protein [Gammaproteobacteria bacterium]
AGTWATQSNGVSFSMTQIMPDQARAFYVNRGFKLEQIEDYATSCVYMTVIRNDSAPGVIHFVLQDWSITHEGQERPPRKITDWINRLKERGGTDPALIAFRWAQFPPEQEYEPGGDWNQGMLSTGMPVGSKFNVTARWEMGGKVLEGILRNVHCAK